MKKMKKIDYFLVAFAFVVFLRLYMIFPGCTKPERMYYKCEIGYCDDRPKEIITTYDIKGRTPGISTYREAVPTFYVYEYNEDIQWNNSMHVTRKLINVCYVEVLEKWEK